MEKKIIALLADILEMEANEIKLQDKFREYEKWDSLSYLSVIAMLDEEFDVQIETNEFKPLITIENLVDAITKI